MGIILELMENFFIVWFILVCFGEMISKNISKFIAVGIAVTCSSLLSQQLSIFNNVAIDMLFCMFVGIISCVLILEVFYFNMKHITKTFLVIFLYFIVCIISGEQLYLFVISPFINGSFMQMDALFKFFIIIPYRLIEVFIFIIIGISKRRKIHEEVF